MSSQPHKSAGRFSRRKMLIGGGCLAVGAALLARPGDNSAPVTPYFLRLSEALKKAGIAKPTLIVDRHRLQANVDVMMQNLPAGMGYRIVTKSLPSFGLIDDVVARSGSRRMMVFNLDFLKTLSGREGVSDILLGKPLPIAAAADFLKSLKPMSPSEAGVALDSIQWLVDTPERIAQYATLAEAHNLTLKLNLEIDVGLHRGGFVGRENIAQALALIGGSKHLSFSGFMGYEPHITAVPKVLGLQERAKTLAWDLYADALGTARAVLGNGYNPDHLTRNAAGSPTYRLYKDTALANEIAVGSALVKPTHFDTDLLEAHQPAAFIATPVIKSSEGLNIPHLGAINGLMEMWDPNKRKTIFIHGGNWYADPVSPQGLRNNSLFGRSSNQEMFNTSVKTDLAPDDFVFLRPHQSEAVFLQFGDIAVYEDGEIVDYWPVFTASA